MKKNISLLIVLLLIVLTACQKQVSSNVIKTTTTEANTTVSETKNNTGVEFMEKFSEKYPDYTLLDYKLGSDESAPVLFVGIAKNKESKLSNTLFIVDKKGIGQLELASDKIGIYRQEDGLKLENNKIFLSLDLLTKKKTFEIHDFKIEVIKKEIEKDVFDTTYKSNETIRED